ncbi:MBL fold metallo-hydrolase [Neobacillus sp. NPDC093127]|uniref:MBL fold metallo-hydrolase n=1 Tax=Neobacillus sp. NPDC093127 TaxID=3364296 RepID=UPI0038222BAD
MFTVEEIFERAVFYENRNQISDAKCFYDQLIDYDENISLKIIERAAQFYCGRGDVEKTNHYSKKGILQGGNIGVFGELLTCSFELAEVQNKKDLSFIEFLSEQPNVKFYPSVHYRTVKILMKNGKNVYHELLTLNQSVEQLFLLNSSEYASLYVEITLLLIELEWKKGNIPQSRFYLRKLLGLPFDYLSNTEEIFAWAIQLDLLFSELQTRKDFIRLRSQISREVNHMIDVIIKIETGTFSLEEANLLRGCSFNQQFLEKKKLLYLLYLKSLINRLAPKEIEALICFPKDWLAVKLYVSHTGLEGLPFFNKVFTDHADLPEAVKWYQRLIATKNSQVVQTSLKGKNTQEISSNTSLEEVSVTVFGGGEKIGGTSILVSVKGHHILLDAGMHLNEETFFPNYSLLDEMGLSFRDLDALLISHAHLDHTGAVPYVHAINPELPIYATEETRAIMRVLLKDLWKNNHGEEGFYSEAVLQSTLYSILPMKQSFIIPSKGSYWKVTVFPSGHILGAVSIYLEMEGVNILFTGDYSIENQYTVKGMSLPEDLPVDVLITEGTYGYQPSNTRLSRKEQEQELINQIETVMERKGTLLIPAFAVGRSQEIVLILKNYFKDKPYLPFYVYLDGMVPEVCKIYEQYSEAKQKDSLFFGGGILVASQFYQKGQFDSFFKQSIEQGRNVIISSSGMLAENSASARYAEKLVTVSENSIAFTGYLDEESPGFKLSQLKYHNEKNLVINGKEKPIQAEIVNFRLSAHASREEIIHTVLSLNPRRVLLVHGEHEQIYQAPRSDRKAYFTLLDLLADLPMEVIAAKNGTIYLLEDQG